MRISEIFYSLQGEGFLAGVPSVFVRLAGCPLRCRWCDTKYGWDEKVVRTALAALFKNGSIEADPKSNNSFVVGRNFRNAVFSVGIALSNEEKQLARKLISEIFGADAGIHREFQECHRRRSWQCRCPCRAGRGVSCLWGLRACYCFCEISSYQQTGIYITPRQYKSGRYSCPSG